MGGATGDTKGIRPEEGLEELFTVNRLGLSPDLCRVLSTTNLIENPHSAVRRRTRSLSVVFLKIWLLLGALFFVRGSCKPPPFRLN